MRFEKYREALRERRLELRATLLRERDSLDEINKKEYEDAWEKAMLADEARTKAIEDAGELVAATISIRKSNHPNAGDCLSCFIETISIITNNIVTKSFSEAPQRGFLIDKELVLEEALNNCPPILRIFLVAYEKGELERVNRLWDITHDTPPIAFKLFRSVYLKEALRELGYLIVGQHDTLVTQYIIVKAKGNEYD